LAEKIANTKIKLLGGSELSVNVTSHEQMSSKPQPDEKYGMTKTYFFQQFILEHLLEIYKIPGGKYSLGF
jgi:hypothetical protein